jgi:rubrerythrin
MKQQQTPLGFNRTGIQMSPIDAERMKEGIEELESVEPAELGYAEIRQSYADDAEDGLGSVPVPGTVKGMLQSGAKMITGKHPQVLIDKLGERLAFERGGVRLYESLLVKCSTAPDLVPNDELAALQQFRDEEAQHFAMVVEAIERLGGDPTAQTPCADLVGVESLGLVQAMNDPRSSVLQALHVMLNAELLDNAGWEMLIGLARSIGQEDIAERFTLALQQEGKHLRHLQALVTQLTLQDAGVDDDVVAMAS